MKIGFIGLGNVGSKLSGSLLRNAFDLTVHDVNESLVNKFIEKGAKSACSGKDIAEKVDVVITCLPSPAICAQVMEGSGGVLEGLSEGKIWLEMSTTESHEVKRLGEKVRAIGAIPVDCPVSGGCHRADTGNISIFAGCERSEFEQVLPILTTMGRRILHTGPLGSASILKVMTNYLATANLISCTEALSVACKMGLDMNKVYEAFRISSGNSFVHETESQVILNGSRDISFTMDLVLKDIGLFQSLADEHQVPLELSPLLVKIFKDGIRCYGERELSPNIIRRLEDACDIKVLGRGFPNEMTDDEPEEPGYEIKPQ